VLHELATNAVKHGELSLPAGRIALNWTFASGLAYLNWRETGGAPVVEPTGQGFGTRLFGTALAPHGGTVERHFKRDGLLCAITIPAALQETT
jgi:two-component sensor histidine kinase